MMKKTSGMQQSTTGSQRALILLTNTAFIPHKSRMEEEQWIQQQSQEQARNPRHHVKEFTGVDFYELAWMWVALTKHANMQVDLVSPLGGAVPADPDSLQRLAKDEKLMKEIHSIHDFVTEVSHTWPIKAVKPSEYNLAIVLGSYGSMFDLPNCSTVESILSDIYHKQDGHICTIGHGAAALINIPASTSTSAINTDYLIRNKKIACFTNREEKEQRFDRVLPFLLEDKLKERGAKIQEADPFKPNVVVDERLITAQNAASIRDFIKKISEKAIGKSIDI